MPFSQFEADRLNKESAAAHNQWMGAMQLKKELFDHLGPAAARACDQVTQRLMAAYDQASEASLAYPQACLDEMRAAADQADQSGALFAVVAKHEGSTALAA